jgi:hypothetical protein
MYVLCLGLQWSKVLMEVVRVTPKDEKEVLYMCGDKFTAANEDSYAKETFIRVGDVSRLMAFYTKRQMWPEAAKLAEEYQGDFEPEVFIPYAEWLVTQDR